MELIFNIPIVFSGILSLLFSVIAFFIRQLHNDFRKVEQNISEIKISTELIKANMRSAEIQLSQKMSFLEKRIERVENLSNHQQQNGNQKYT